jgi:hypothetical protein
MKNPTRFSISRRALLQNISLLCGAALLPARASSIENTQPAFIYAMALVPPPDIAAACSEIRKQFDPSRSNKTFPHITLKQPLTMMGNQKTAEQALLQSNKKYLRTTRPLTNCTGASRPASIPPLTALLCMFALLFLPNYSSSNKNSFKQSLLSAAWQNTLLLHKKFKLTTHI